MREALRRFLVDNVAAVRVESAPGVTDYDKSRVKELHGVTALKDRPFIVLVEGPLDPGEQWAGIATALDVWPHVEHTKFTTLDAFANEISALLNELILEDGEKRYYLEKLATGGDQHVPEWETITRVLRFSIFDLEFLSGETIDPDPVEALARWTDETFGVDVQTDPASWRPSREQPGIYWRISTIPRVLEWYPFHTWVEARIMGHVIAPTYTARLEWTRRIHQALLSTRKLELADGSPLFIEGLGADSGAHPIRTGQITAVCRLGVLSEIEEAPVIERVVIGGDVVNEQEVS